MENSGVKEEESKQIICVKWGKLYGPEYVNRLYGMVERNITPPFRLICFTDDDEGVRSEVECFELPELGVPHPVNTYGKWRKQVLWGEKLPGVDGVVLFIDLDSVIVDSLDPYFSYGHPDDVILARNWARPLSGLGQTSVFRYRVGSHPYVLENFKKTPQAIADKFGYEQHYVTKSIKPAVKFWPEKWTKHFRLHCLPIFPLRLFLEAKIPTGCRIITFPGGPNPDDISVHRWRPGLPIEKNATSHLKKIFKNKFIDQSAKQKMKEYFKPVTWLRKYWRE